MSARRRRSLATSVLVAALVPAILVANGVHAIAHDWFVQFEYGREGFPPDHYGLSTGERAELALTGLHSVQPGNGDGLKLLRRARLPSGEPAFTGREVEHMRDVRHLLEGLYGVQFFGLVAIAALALRARPTAARGIRWGAAATLALAAGTCLAVVADADAYLTAFHRVFFEGDSWRFAETDTLIRLYPDRFWQDTAKLLTLGAAAQALLLVTADRVWARRTKLQTATWRGSA